MAPIVESDSDDEVLNRTKNQSKSRVGKNKKHVRIEEDYNEEGNSLSEGDENIFSEDEASERPSSGRKKKKLANKNLQGASGGYAWEEDIQRSWDLVKVDDEGNMAALVSSIIEARKKRTSNKNLTPFQRGIIRTMVLVLDCSCLLYTSRCV